MTRWRLRTFQYLERLFPLRLVAWHLEPLASYHVDHFLDAHVSRWLGCVGLRRLPGRWCLVRPASAVLRKAGLNRHFIGHTLLVVFERREPGE